MFRARKILPLVLAFLPTLAFAHPHVWVNTKVEVILVAGYLEKLQVEWSFDELFTSMVLMDNDADGDGQLSAPESSNVKRTYFDNLKGYNYFAHLRLGKTELVIPTITEFRAAINAEGRAVYRFSVPVGQRLDAKTAFAFGFYDESFYTDMVFDKKDPVVLTVSEGGKATVVVKPNLAKAYYGGQVVPIEANVSWRPS